MQRAHLAERFDHTLLAAEATSLDVRRVAGEVLTHGMRGLCVAPCWVPLGRELLGAARPRLVSIVGFPFGTETTAIKARQAGELVGLGADELDMVMRLGALKEGRWDEVRADIVAVVEAAQGRPVKVILECGVLEDDEKRQACELVAEAGAAFVKTSTGFHPRAGGATVEDTRLLATAADGRLQVKASAGIRRLDQALALLEAGADVLGCSASVDILAELTRAAATGPS